MIDFLVPAGMLLAGLVVAAWQAWDKHTQRRGDSARRVAHAPTVRDPWDAVLVTHDAVFGALPQSMQDGLRPDLAQLRRFRQSLGVTCEEAATGLLFLPTIPDSWIKQEAVRQ